MKVCQDKFPKGDGRQSAGYYMDGYLKSNLDDLKEDVLRDFDAFLIVDGRERFGKSTLAMQVAFYLDNTFCLARVCFTIEQFVEAVNNAEKYTAIVFDEAYGYLNSRQAISKFNKTLIKIFAEMGSKNLFIIICIPNFFELDKYPAIHRSTSLLHVYERANYKAKFGAYNFNTKVKLYSLGKKFYDFRKVAPNFTGDFTKFFPIDKEEYEKKKRESVLK